MSTPENIDPKSAAKVQGERKKTLSAETLAKRILAGDKTALARGLTLVESTKEEHMIKAQTVLEICLQQKKESVRIGITGVPGVGKSTFIEAFGLSLTKQGKKVAVLAVDPSSAISKGSILGDKTRMQELVKTPNAFIRPSPAGESLGGVARKTRESVVLCEAAGYNCILIETVGVGQSETAVHSMVDFFLLLKLAGAGDELQGIKRGIMEMADAILINKADGDNLKRANLAKLDFQRALHLFPPKANGWVPKVMTCSSLAGTGITEVWEMIAKYLDENRDSGAFSAKRRNQNEQWLFQSLEDALNRSFYEHPKVKKALKKLLPQVTDNLRTPSSVAQELLQLYGKELK